MSEKINVQCYKCKTVYELEYELRGQLVECAVCSTLFIVPELGEDHPARILQTNPYIEDGDQIPAAKEGRDPNLETVRDLNRTSGSGIGPVPTKTKTIKLSKARCGMIPQIDDKFGICSAPNPHHQQHHEADVLEDFAKTHPKSAREAPEDGARWWPWKHKKKQS
ncbi:MAG: hypothetical protein PHH77_08615 [Victivallaceae bacterium]|nr:hypothetical protein [Victivallaceae bacterium]